MKRRKTDPCRDASAVSPQAMQAPTTAQRTVANLEVATIASEQTRVAQADRRSTIWSRVLDVNRARPPSPTGGGFSHDSVAAGPPSL